MSKTICHNCIEDTFLKSSIEKTGTLGLCSFCHVGGKVVSMETLANYVEEAISQHYRQTPVDPSDYESMLIREFSHCWERAGEPISSLISGIAGLDKDIAEEIRVILHYRTYDLDEAQMGIEFPFDEDAQYEESDCSEGAFTEKWDKFKSKLNTEARYFSRELLEILDDVFSGLESHTTLSGTSVVVNAGPGSSIPNIYRSRVFQSREKLEKALIDPDLEIGPPPAKYAKSGRMNARGIPVFYGSMDFYSAIAEVRPPVGSRVAVMRFDIIRPIRLLNLPALGTIKISGSVFDPDYIQKLQRAKFLKRLQELMTQVVMPDDEDSEYLVTQAVAGYLAVEKKLDGIIYPSSQSANHKNNAVLFSHSALIERIPRMRGTSSSVSSEWLTEEGPEISYSVFDEIPQGPGSATTRNAAGGFVVALRHNWKELCVYHVTGTTFNGNAYQVNYSSRVNPKLVAEGTKSGNDADETDFYCPQ